MSDEDVFENVPGIEEDLARAEQKLEVRIERRTYDKPVTIIEGFDEEAVDVKAVASDLKSGLGAGGTTTDGTIEVQGDHRDRVIDLLEEKGFAVET